ncbi:MAG: hypothetical protein AAGK02_07260 [Pseudomonadota bacterium]
MEKTSLPNNDFANELIKALEEAVRTRVSEAGHPIIEKALADFETELRNRVAEFAVALVGSVDMYRREDRLIIEVKNPRATQ